MLAAPGTSGPRISTSAELPNAPRYSNRTSSPRNGNGANPAPTSLRQQRGMIAETASNGMPASPATTALGSSNSSEGLADLKNMKMRRGSGDETISTSIPSGFDKEEDTDGDEHTQSDSTGGAGEGTSARAAIDIQALLQSPNTNRRQEADPAKDDISRTNPQKLSPPKRARAAQRAPKVLPVRYELCDVEDMVILVANMVSELIQTNDNLPLRGVVLTRFHSRLVHPSILYHVDTD